MASMGTIWRHIWALFLVVALLTGCGEREPSIEANPNSGGLGLTHDEWIAAYGKPDEASSGSVLFEQDSVASVFHMDFGEEGGYQPILFNVRFAVPVDKALAETYVSQHIPKDATVVEEYSRPQDDSSVILYHSDWLASAMDGPWVGAEPGSFLAVYYWNGESESSGIASVLVATSHNP